ncbi:MAG: glutamine synthetase [Chitinivibrionales bacterium]|nr:glutamine synthetase [Chitinivibrionales bacterium]
MKEFDIAMNPNKLVQYLKKPANEFTRQDIVKFIEDNHIKMVNLRFVAGDGRLKTLNFVINNKKHLEELLTAGERVDGSSLFGYVDASSSDLYVIPRYRTAFVNPFSDIPAVDLLCSFYNHEGKPLESAPEYILRKAHAAFKKATGYTFRCLGELEYYIINDKNQTSTLFPATDQKGYHESEPFTKWGHFRREALRYISECNGVIKYGHSEVGNFTNEYGSYEQNEVEFLPIEAEDAADELVVAKWVLRSLGAKYGVNITFAPKITVGKAGSGMHIHMCLEKDGVNITANEKGLSDTARKAIAGVLDLAGPLTAFGNTIPTSYLRLVPHQEAPTNICWGDRNRSVLVRVPLGWTTKVDMIREVNPQEKTKSPDLFGKQTFELRSPDGSADVYMTIAGLIVAVQHGLEMEDGLKRAQEMYVDVNIFDEEHKEKVAKLKQLPASCHASAEALAEKREYFEKNHVFPKGTLDYLIKKLKSYNDANLSEQLYNKSHEIKALVDKYLHCM